MTSRFARLHPAPRRLTATERLTLRFAEFLFVAAFAIFGSTLHSPGEFIVGLGTAFVLFEVARWEAAGGG